MYLFIFYAEQKYAELSMGYHTWQHVTTIAEHSKPFRNFSKIKILVPGQTMQEKGVAKRCIQEYNWLL